MSPRIPAVLAVALLAVLSCVSFPVTDSWFSDTDSVDVSVSVPDAEVTDLLFMVADVEPNDDGSFTLPNGEYSLTVFQQLILTFTDDSGSTPEVAVEKIVDSKNQPVELTDRSFKAVPNEAYIIKVGASKVTVTGAVPT